MNFNLEAWQVLNRAVRGDDIQSFGRLLSEHPEFIQGNNDRGSLLNTAACTGRIDHAKLLINRGADVNYFEEVGGTALCSAALHGHQEVARLLIQAGASLNHPDINGNALFAAIYQHQIAMVAFLIDSGLDPHIVYRLDDGRLRNAYSFAQFHGFTDSLKILATRGCHPPLEDENAPVKELMAEPIELSAADLRREEAVRYMSDRFGAVDYLGMQELFPIMDDMSVAINVICPNDEHPYLVLFTNGMSDRPMKVPPGQEAWKYAELVIYLPANCRILATRMAMHSGCGPFSGCERWPTIRT